MQRERRKTIHNDRAKYEVEGFVFRESLPHFPVDSFLPSRGTICPCVEPPHPLSSEVVCALPTTLGEKSSFLDSSLAYLS